MIFGYVVCMVPNFFFKKPKLLGIFVLGLFMGVLGRKKFLLIEGPADVGSFLFSAEAFFVLLGLGLVLFLALVCVVKVCYFRKGSLRPFSSLYV